MTNILGKWLAQATEIHIRQRFEVAEWLGFETRNKYDLLDEKGLVVGHAAEQQKGLWGFLMRQGLGHWRTFDLHVWDKAHAPAFQAHHPFRWFFQRLDVYTPEGSRIGTVARRWALFGKHFDIEDEHGQVLLTVRSPWYRIWTFPFVGPDGKEAAVLTKVWSGVLTEALTDQDRFKIEFSGLFLDSSLRTLILAAALYVDLLYFESKAKSRIRME